MSRDTVIRAEGLGKKYVIGHAADRERYTTLRDVLVRNASNVWRTTLDMARGRPIVSGDTIEEFWALKDLDFEIKRGEIIGIIGRNGAGKTTLLKILSRITEPTSGRVTITGRVASLLEVGTGFHPELTGRENIYLNGAILGMGRAEIRRKFDEIVAFAEVERFLDTPVKRYSSGMYVRLAFAVAAHLDTDIMIVDEVLAVGDAAFQKKCLGKMGDISNSGRTVLFVSHNIGSLMSICRSGILLNAGSLVGSGSIGATVKSYYELGHEAPSLMSAASFQGPLKGVRLDSVVLNGNALAYRNTLSPKDGLSICIHGYSLKTIPNFRFAMSLSCDGSRLLTVTDGPETLVEGEFEFKVDIPPFFLRPNELFISLGGRRVDGDEWIWATDIATITVNEEWSESYERDNEGLVDPSLIASCKRFSGLTFGGSNLSKERLESEP
jgi:ABC-type polysaccharide/polyol phosphate transport system ATPase subunit